MEIIGIFHKDEDLNVWNHILSSLEDGYVRSSVRNFSQYGLFSAPITDTPAATPQSGTWAANTVVSLSATENAVIYYTTDGSDPTLESAVYVDQPLIVGDGLEVRAIAVEPNHRVSTVAVFSYSEAVPEPSSALRFGTISGHGSYFDFDSGSMTTDSYTGDIRLSALSIIGGEYQQHLQEYKGNYFPRPGEADQWNLPFSRFQDLTEEDWEDDPHDQTGSGWVYPGDTLLIETTAGKFVKMVILQERIQAGVGDAPAIDFLYVYDQDSDTQAPTLLTVSLETQDGTVFTVPVTETISFSVDSEPLLLFFEFDEEVYPHRYLHSYDDGTARSEIRFETELGWTQMPAAKTLRAPVYWTGGDEITIKEAPNYNGMPIDNGYYFSDVSGNALFQLPFEEIVIQVLE